jgi:plasmid stabilization system protein ParE
VRAIHDHIAKDNPRAAAKWIREFSRQARSLVQLPLRYGSVAEAVELGRPWREIIVGNFRIMYRVDINQVTILRVIHSAMLLDRSFFTKSPRD